MIIQETSKKNRVADFTVFYNNMALELVLEKYSTNDEIQADRRSHCTS